MIAVVLNLFGAVALLLWSVRMVRTGAERGFADRLRHGLHHATGNPIKAGICGVLAAIIMQSSTAVAMLAVSFATAGFIGTATGLILLLGADLGSAIAARILLLPIGAVIPFLLLVGVVLFTKSRSKQLKQAGRMLIGLALVLVSLGMLRAATEPMRESELVGAILRYLSGDLIACFVIGAVFAWMVHSSVAAVLLFITLAAEGLITGNATVALVLGANLGGAVIPVGLTIGSELEGRVIAIGNLAIRGGAAIIGVAALHFLQPNLSLLGASPAVQAINLHLLFNAAVLLAGTPLAPRVTMLVQPLIPKQESDPEKHRVSALNKAALANPDLALGCASREVLQMGEFVGEAFAPALDLFRDWDASVANRIALLEDEIDKMHFETKLYGARIQEGQLTQEQARQAMNLVTLANHFEDAGDQISTNLVDIAKRLNKGGLEFSNGGLADLAEFHERVLANSQLSLSTLMTGDVAGARQLVAEKDATRRFEKELQERHLQRLRNGTQASIETSNLHQEAIRAFKQVNTAFCFVAYPIVEEAGDLRSTRLSSTG